MIDGHITCFLSHPVCCTEQHQGMWNTLHGKTLTSFRLQFVAASML